MEVPVYGNQKQTGSRGEDTHSHGVHYDKHYRCRALPQVQHTVADILPVEGEVHRGRQDGTDRKKR